MIKSCYIHIPFCKKICSYCDFCKNYYNELVVDNYLDNLKKEISKNYKNEVLDTLYIGGGTPSSLSKNNLNKLINILKLFKLNNSYEFTFECNYEDINEELLDLLKNNKVNRISIGIQTFNDKFSKVLNRDINKKEMIEKINLTKKYFSNINIDLMYALPGESINDLKMDLEIIKKLDVTHISTYALIIEDHTNLKLQNIKETCDDIQNKMYYLIVDYLKNNGYNHYELSNFAKENYESRHNLTYWNNDNYYGFGAGASGFIDNIRYDNTKSVFKYNAGITKVYEEKLSLNELMKDEVMLSLRKINGINKNAFYKKYNVLLEDAFDYKNLIRNNFLTETSKNVYINENELFVSNEIIIMFLNSYLLEQKR